MDSATDPRGQESGVTPESAERRELPTRSPVRAERGPRGAGQLSSPPAPCIAEDSSPGRPDGRDTEMTHVCINITDCSLVKFKNSFDG